MAAAALWVLLAFLLCSACRLRRQWIDKKWEKTQELYAEKMARVRTVQQLDLLKFYRKKDSRKQGIHARGFEAV